MSPEPARPGRPSTLLRNLRAFFGLAAALALLAPHAAVGQDAPAEETRPNFVLVLTDDQTYRAIGYNNPFVQTPALDALANEGIIFDYAYVATPICAASRASLLTGRFPQEHGAVALDRTPFVEAVVERGTTQTLAHRLAEGGYRTAFYGKSHLGDPTLYGFEEGAELGEDAAVFDSAAAFLERAAARSGPFLLWVAPHAPHVPLRPAPRWLDLYDAEALPLDPNFREAPPEGSLFNQGLPGEQFYRDADYTDNYRSLPAGPPRTADVMRAFTHAYYATISRLDHQVGALVAALKRQGLYENTTLVFLSDNGYFLGNHGLGNKITMHEESVRVPMFIHGAGVAARGARSGALVSSLDVYPTLLELAGLEPADAISGRSLVPLLSRPGAPFRTSVASESVGVGGRLGEGHRMIRTQTWKYVLSGTNEEALYHERWDPYERVDLVGTGTAQEALHEMRALMRAWMDAVGDTHERPPPTGVSALGGRF